MDECSDKKSCPGQDWGQDAPEPLSKSFPCGSDTIALVTLTPAVLLTVIGFVMELSVAFEVISEHSVQYFFLFVYGVALVGMLGMAVLHACNMLTNSDEACKRKSVFITGGIYVLGSGGMIYQGVDLYGSITAFEDCPSYPRLVLRTAALLFSGMQVFTLIKLQTVRINKHALVTLFSRCVLMHLVATNICLWFLTIIEESMHEIYGEEEAHGPSNSVNHTSRGSNYAGCETHTHLSSIIVPYTYPLLIEFCVVAANLHFTVWERCGTYNSDEKLSVPVSTTEFMYNHIVPYRSSGVGIVLGWLVILLTIIFVLVYLYDSYVDVDYSTGFGMIVYGFNMALHFALLVAVMITGYRMKVLRSAGSHTDISHQEARDKTVVIVTFLAMACYKLFSMIAGVHEEELIILADGVVSVLGGLSLTVFLNYYLPHRRLAFVQQRASKPGKQGLEFIRCVNFALWLGNTFLLKTTSAKIPMEHTYGDLPWAIVSNIVQPLTILYYFHAMMCISEAITRVHTWYNDGLSQTKYEMEGSLNGAASADDVRFTM